MAANDALARGARSVAFPSNSHIEQSKWDLAFGGPRPLNISKPEKKNETKKPRRKSA